MRTLVSFTRICSVLLGLLLLPGLSVLRAQTAVDGALSGRVVDSTGAAIAGAVVKTKNGSTGEEQSTGSDGRGLFRLIRLTPGTYAFEVSAPGFATLHASAVTIRVGEATVLTAEMAIAGSDAINVQDADRPVATEKTSFSSHISSTEMRLLPTNGREWSSFALLTPGTNSDARGLISFRGITSILNSHMIDGGDDNQLFYSNSRGRTHAAYSFSQEAVREFQVNTSNYAAQYGGAAGGVVNTVSRSGGDRTHGTLFWIRRDSRWSAINPFSIATSFSAPVSTVPGVATSEYVKPKDVRDQFGGSVSGWIVKQRLFYFYAYDEQRRNFPAVSAPASASFFSLTQDQRALLQNTREISTAQINVALTYLSGLGGEAPRRGDQTINFPKLDWITEHQHASVQYNRLRWSSPGGVQTEAVVPRGLASFGNDAVRVDAAIARWAWLFGARTSNEVHYQHSRDFEYETGQQPLPQEPHTGPGGLAPQVRIAPEGFSFGTPSTLNRAAYPDERRNQVADLFTMVRGRHLVSAGVDFSTVDERIDNLPNEEGSFYYDAVPATDGSGQPNGLADWITDFTYSANSYPNGGCKKITDLVHNYCYKYFTQGFGQHAYRFPVREWAGFVQDTWHPATHLTMDFGVRYEYEQLPPAQQPNLALDALFSKSGATAVLPSDKNNIAPRLGMAWDPFGKGRTVVRAGYGVFYGRIVGATIKNALSDTALLGSGGLPASTFHIRVNPKVITTCPSVPSTGFGYPCSFPNFPGGVVAQTSSAVFFDKHFQAPMVQEGEFTVEHEPGWKMVLGATYLMSLSRELPNFGDVNIAPSTSNATFSISGGPFNGKTFVLPLYTARVSANYGPVTDIRSNVSGSYNALVLSARRRIEQTAVGGLDLRVHWTWSKALDYGQNSTVGTQVNAQLDPFDIRYDKGISTLNHPHRVVVGVLWEPRLNASSRTVRAVVNGWQLVPVFTETSGRPYSYGVRGGTYLAGGRESLNGSGGARYLPTVGRNTLRLPDTRNLDLRLAREVHVAERARLRLSAEAFNLLNRTNYSRIYTTAYDAAAPVAGVTTLTYQSAAVNPAAPFGQFTAASTEQNRERQVQISVRLEF